MKVYAADKLRNVALVGHGSEGKTILAEAMLFTSGAIDRMGRVEDGNTVSDYDTEEVKRTISISASLIPVEWNDYKVNIIDAPGYFDFEGEQLQALRLADSAMIVVGGVSGMAVGTEKAYEKCRAMGLPSMVFVNQMDREHADYQKVIAGLQEKYGVRIAPVAYPILEGTKVVGYVDVIAKKAYKVDGKKKTEIEIPANLADQVEECNMMLVEAAAESDDELLEKYFGGEELTEEEIRTGLRTRIAVGEFTPAVGGAALSCSLIDALLDTIIALMPAPCDGAAKVDENGDEIACDASGSVVAQVIKTVADPFVGKLSLMRVYRGTVKSGTTLNNTNSQKAEKIGTVYTMRGQKQIEVDGLGAGDIGAVAKLANTNSGDTLCDTAESVVMPQIEFPAPCISLAVTAAKKGEEDKVFGGLARLEEEDPTFRVSKDPDTLETLISGMGELHLEIVIKKLQNKFRVSAVTAEPRIPYRETIRKTVKAQGRHKKQSGGHGQFGDVWIEYEPIEDGFEFVDKVVGGVVPRNFIPAVEKGLRENLGRGVLAGFPLVGLRATLYDGSYHPVDSSEMAFKTAARLSLRKGCAEANPVLLEPIYRVDVFVPDDYMGDVIGDMNRRRGRVLGMNPTEGGGQQVTVEVPASEISKYATDLRSMTQARGSFVREFARYEEVPGNIAQKVIETYKREEEDED
ncbi:MAG: elongation factor G [Clostridia bacterium]|nr:elongation factor G [Clostridia bacterium]